MKPQRAYFSVEKDGFFGAYFPSPNATDRCMIALLGDDIDDHMVVSSVKWLHSRNCNVMTIAPGCLYDWPSAPGDSTPKRAGRHGWILTPE